MNGGRRKYKRRYRHQSKAKKRKVLSAVFLSLVIVFFFGLYLYDIRHPEFLNHLLPDLRGDAQIMANQLSGDTQVHFIDVGQGDSVLLYQNGSYALIDAGTEEEGQAVISHLQNLHIKKLDYVFMTHPHADHLGGMRAVLDEFQVEKVILPDFEKGPTPTSFQLEKLLRSIEEKNIPTEIAEEGKVYPLGAGKITVLLAGIPTENLNDISIVTMFEANGWKCLNTGDGEENLEEALLEKYKDTDVLQANVFKAGHHGSKTSNTLPFLEAVQPDVFVISCGENNDYGHPHREVLKSADKIRTQVYRTDLHGTVAVCFENGITTVITQREAQV